MEVWEECGEKNKGNKGEGKGREGWERRKAGKKGKKGGGWRGKMVGRVPGAVMDFFFLNLNFRFKTNRGGNAKEQEEGRGSFLKKKYK